jgi:hypothetical protein
MPAAPFVGAVTTPARGVLLVHGERERAEPLPGDRRRAVRLDLVELLADRPGPALDLQDAGQHAVRVKTGVHAGGHGVPDRIEARRDILFGPQRHLVLARDIGDGDAALVAQRQQ